jgi:hypothetical protein
MPGRAYPNPYLGPIITLGPSSLEDWLSCRRRYRNRHLLELGDYGGSPSADTGRAVHDLLHRIHEAGLCGDQAAVGALCDAHYPGQAHLLLPYVAEHENRCPSAVDWSLHEHSLARYMRRSNPRWLVTGRIDAVWAHGGILDARDYKTGLAYYERVADDLAARVQAFLLAPLAAEHSLSLRITYEHLNGEPSPDLWDVEDEDVEAARAELHRLATEIAEEENFAGCDNRLVCANCRFQSCTDRAA